MIENRISNDEINELLFNVSVKMGCNICGRSPQCNRYNDGLTGYCGQFHPIPTICIQMSCENFIITSINNYYCKVPCVLLGHPQFVNTKRMIPEIRILNEVFGRPI